MFREWAFHPKHEKIPELDPYEYYQNRITGDVMQVRFAMYRPTTKTLWGRITKEEYLKYKKIHDE